MVVEITNGQRNKSAMKEAVKHRDWTVRHL
jgi:hypothetical protein